MYSWGTEACLLSLEVPHTHPPCHQQPEAQRSSWGVLFGNLSYFPTPIQAREYYPSVIYEAPVMVKFRQILIYLYV